MYTSLCSQNIFMHMEFLIWKFWLSFLYFFSLSVDAVSALWDNLFKVDQKSYTNRNFGDWASHKVPLTRNRCYQQIFSESMSNLK